ncbi:MAG: hypothetical protein V4689_16540 [Verrucomicrobiota bacterium]
MLSASSPSCAVAAIEFFSVAQIFTISKQLLSQIRSVLFPALALTDGKAMDAHRNTSIKLEDGRVFTGKMSQGTGCHASSYRSQLRQSTILKSGGHGDTGDISYYPPRSRLSPVQIRFSNTLTPGRDAGFETSQHRHVC